MFYKLILEYYLLIFRIYIMSKESKELIVTRFHKLTVSGLTCKNNLNKVLLYQVRETIYLLQEGNYLILLYNTYYYGYISIFFIIHLSELIIFRALGIITFDITDDSQV